MTTTKTATGGARKGAGRPKGSTKPDTRSLTTSVRLTDAERVKAARIGGGKPCRGMHVALIACQDAGAEPDSTGQRTQVATKLTEAGRAKAIRIGGNVSEGLRRALAAWDEKKD